MFAARVVLLSALAACAPSQPPVSKPPEPAPHAACESVSSCEPACDRGDLEGCYELGRRLRRGVEVEADFTRAREVLGRACEGGFLDACAELGALYRFGDGVDPNVERARGLYERACEGGSLLGCTALGALYQAGVSSLGKDPARAHAIFRRSCQKGEQTACTMLALAILRGEVDEASEDPAALLDTACASGLPEGCALRGELLLQGPGSDPERAIEHLTRGCEAGASAGCLSLAYLHLEGKRLPRDAERADELLRFACKIDGRTCGHLAARLNGGPSPDPAAAASFYERACAQWEPKSCLVLSEMLEAGSGLPADPGRAVELRKRACELGLASACK